MQFNLLVTLLALLIGLSTAQFGYGPRGYGPYDGFGPRYGPYGRGPRPWGPRFGRPTTIIEKTVIVRPGGWRAKL